MGQASSKKESNKTMNEETNNTAATIVNEETLHSTRWVALKVVDYKNGIDDTTRKWEYVTRTTKQPNTPDAVIIIPILKSSKLQESVMETILVEQYRPPCATHTLEFPAGLIDKGESPKQAALRELWEETGFTGTVNDDLSTAAELCMSPGVTDETITIIVVDVDLDDPKNDNPVQHLEDGESVVVKRVPLTVGLKDLLTGESKKGVKHHQPISMLYSFALGLEIGAKLNK